MYGKLEKLIERVLAKLHPSNFNVAIHKFRKIQFRKKKIICHRIPIQTLEFLTALPTRQDGVENRDKAYCSSKSTCLGGQSKM